MEWSIFAWATANLISEVTLHDFNLEKKNSFRISKTHANCFGFGVSVAVGVAAVAAVFVAILNQNAIEMKIGTEQQKNNQIVQITRKKTNKKQTTVNMPPSEICQKWLWAMDVYLRHR